jgi:adhesin/invasin
MLLAFMLSRLRRAIVPAVIVSSLGIGGCEKVPLLAPSGSTLTLTASATALPLNGATQLIAQVIEPAGTPPHSGTAITFTTTLGSIEPADATTDSAGRAVVTFKAGTSNGTASISAISGGVSASGNNAIKIAIGTAAVGRVIVGASPTLVPSTGGSSTITATVLDINGNALSSAPVTFSTTAGSLSQLVVTSDANGSASTTLQTSTQAVVTASVGAQGTTTTPTTGTTGTTGTTAGQASGTVTVAVAAAPTLLITPPTTLPTVNLPATFTFVVTVPATNGSAVKSVSVNWGDSSTQELGAVTGTNLISHVYHTVNVFTIMATVTDGSGNVVTVQSSVTVIPAALTLTITPPTTPPSAGLPASFTFVPGVPANTGDSVKNVRVNWGDGTASQDLGAISGSTVVVHAFQVAGSYIVTGTLTDAATNVLTVTTSVTVNPRPQPVVSISATTTNPTAGTDMTFTASVAAATGTGTVIQTVSIDFDDGTITPLGAVTGSISLHHVYVYDANKSTYRVVLTATDSNGGVGTATTTVFVQAPTPLGVTLTFTKTTVNATDTLVTFTATVTGLGNSVVQTYHWVFKDGQVGDSTTNTFVHNYTYPGVHPTIQPEVTITTSAQSPNNTATGATVITP